MGCRPIDAVFFLGPGFRRKPFLGEPDACLGGNATESHREDTSNALVWVFVQ